MQLSSKGKRPSRRGTPVVGELAVGPATRPLPSASGCLLTSWPLSRSVPALPPYLNRVPASLCPPCPTHPPPHVPGGHRMRHAGGGAPAPLRTEPPLVTLRGPAARPRTPRRHLLLLHGRLRVALYLGLDPMEPPLRGGRSGRELRVPAQGNHRFHHLLPGNLEPIEISNDRSSSDPAVPTRGGGRERGLHGGLQAQEIHPRGRGQ